jgi:ArsR family transcriptional regulator, arsenate/arsenite/antimonite-responsive transcriptional repressor
MMDGERAVRALGALAHEHRLAVFRALVRAGSPGLAAGEIAQMIGVSPSAMSFHLRELEQAGLTRSWRDGRYIRSSLCVEAMRGLVTFLTEDCCEGRPDLCGNMIASATAACGDNAEDVP